MNELERAHRLADEVGDMVQALLESRTEHREILAALLGCAVAGLRLHGVSAETVGKMVTQCLLNVAREPGFPS
jgi:hypothetical protein